MKINNINKIYLDKNYVTNNPDWHSKDSDYKKDLIINLIKKKPKSILDFGCGSGDVTDKLAEHFNKTLVTGYEVSPIAYKLCKKKKRKNLRFKLIKYKIPKKKYQYLVCLDVIEHIYDFIGLLKKIKTLAKYKIFHIPLDLNLTTQLRPSILEWGFNHLGHIHHFNYNTIKLILKHCNYNIIHEKFTNPIHCQKNIRHTFKQKVIIFLSFLVWKISKRLCTKIFYGFSILMVTK